METKSLRRSSSIASFYKLPLTERLKEVKEFAGLTEEEARVLASGANRVVSASARPWVSHGL